jgi:hypothetical protein
MAADWLDALLYQADQATDEAIAMAKQTATLEEQIAQQELWGGVASNIEAEWTEVGQDFTTSAAEGFATGFDAGAQKQATKQPAPPTGGPLPIAFAQTPRPFPWGLVLLLGGLGVAIWYGGR